MIRPVYRSLDSGRLHKDAVLVPGLESPVDWSQALQGVDVVIHTAARAHIMREGAQHAMAEYRRVNVEGTLNLARQAAFAGVRRFVFISSIKVNGEATDIGRPFIANDPPAPENAYGVSKAEAEAKLKQVAQEMGMEVIIIRPPLIYGPGVKGNLSSLISLMRSGLPLPLGNVINNRRSMVYIDNLVDLILVCAAHPKAANQTFLVSDGEDLSTTELLMKIGKALEGPTRLFSVPEGLISLMAGLVGKKVISHRLLSSLQVDIKKTCELLDWKPSVALDEGIRRTME
jgi:nucleoside-diphosphate-sugar epimerase